MEKSARHMERSDFYLNSCLWMMGILNLIMVLFLAGTITLTQYRIAFAQNARSFLSQLAVMPEQPLPMPIVLLRAMSSTWSWSQRGTGMCRGQDGLPHSAFWRLFWYFF